MFAERSGDREALPGWRGAGLCCGKFGIRSPREEEEGKQGRSRHHCGGFRDWHSLRPGTGELLVWGKLSFPPVRVVCCMFRGIDF